MNNKLFPTNFRFQCKSKILNCTNILHVVQLKGATNVNSLEILSQYSAWATYLDVPCIIYCLKLKRRKNLSPISCDRISPPKNKKINKIKSHIQFTQESKVSVCTGEKK